MPRGVGYAKGSEYDHRTITKSEPKAKAHPDTGGGSWGTDSARGTPRSRDSYGGPASPNYKTHKFGTALPQKGTSNPTSEDSMPHKKTRALQ